jgi:hypothetical protein
MQLTLAQQDSVRYYRLVAFLVKLELEIEMTPAMEYVLYNTINWSLAPE